MRMHHLNFKTIKFAHSFSWSHCVFTVSLCLSLYSSDTKFTFAFAFTYIHIPKWMAPIAEMRLASISCKLYPHIRVQSTEQSVVQNVILINIPSLKQIVSKLCDAVRLPYTKFVKCWLVSATATILINDTTVCVESEVAFHNVCVCLSVYTYIRSSVPHFSSLRKY